MSPSPQKPAGPSELHRVIFSPRARACGFLKNYVVDFIGIAGFAGFGPAGTTKIDFSRGRRGKNPQNPQNPQASDRGKATQLHPAARKLPRWWQAGCSVRPMA